MVPPEESGRPGEVERLWKFSHREQVSVYTRNFHGETRVLPTRLARSSAEPQGKSPLRVWSAMPTVYRGAIGNSWPHRDLWDLGGYVVRSQTYDQAALWPALGTMGGRQRESAAWPECPDRCKSVATEGPHRQPATGTGMLGSDSGNGTCACTCVCVWRLAPGAG
ncbi:uncharacterized protein PG986_002817 [Apiospora aurea]|uniref:Uncharacterized protein n=1 Tax=Apiospora aurea TaxID=335848 RepID=A0ABR1QQS1_9PEZI